MLSKQAERLVNLKLDSEVIESQQTALSKAKQDIKKYTELDQIARQIVPQEKDQAKVTREIVNIANDLGIKIANVTFPTSSLGAPVAKAPTDSATTQVATPTITQVKPVEGIKG